MGAVEGGPPLSWFEDTDEGLWEQMQSLAAGGQIDPISNMADHNVYIFQGTLDSVVPFCKLLQLKNVIVIFL